MACHRHRHRRRSIEQGAARERDILTVADECKEARVGGGGGQAARHEEQQRRRAAIPVFACCTGVCVCVVVAVSDEHPSFMGHSASQQLRTVHQEMKEKGQ